MTTNHGGREIRLCDYFEDRTAPLRLGGFFALARGTADLALWGGALRRGAKLAAELG